MAPGVNGRQTGTVPKTKTHNDSLRDVMWQSRREQSYNNIPNNLVTLDWQPAPDVGHTRTRKTSNTQSASLDYCDFGPEGGAVHDNSRFASPHYSHGEEQQMSWSVMNRCTPDVNGHSEGSASTSSSSRRSRTPHNVLPDRESKSTNITKMPDRNQVVCRLNQIHDYIKQTSSLMDTLKNSGDPRHLAHYHKLSKMVADLRESEGKLQAFLPSLDKDFEPKVQETKSGKSIVECGPEVGNCASDLPSVSVNSHASSVTPGGGRRLAEGSSSGRPESEELSGAVLKSSDSARRNELKMKVEESQRRLQVLQEHQAALLTLQQKAQDQLKEARAAQGMLMARAVGIQCPGAVLPVGEERSAGCTNGTSNSQAPVTQHGVSTSASLQGNIQHIADRLHALHEFHENRNQLVQLLGEGDEELVSEHLVLQDKLQELQYKKQHMDHLVAEFQTLNNHPCLTTGSQVGLGSSKDGSEDGEAECSDCEPDYVVRDKIAELNVMKAQLAQLKGIVPAAQNAGGSNGTMETGIEDGQGAREDGEELEHEEQAVNLRRQKRDRSKRGSVKGVACSNSNTSASGSSKPDNIVQAGSEVERARDIQHKTVQLQEAKARLQHLQDLLAAVTEFRNRGQPLPDQYIDLLSQEAAREEGQVDGGKAEILQCTTSGVQRHSVERERTPVKHQVHESASGLPEGCEVTLEVVQAMTRDLRQQTLNLQEERERLVSARRELGKLQRELPRREKKTNTQVDAQTHQQLLLQAELQAKRRELEELMRKDQGQTSSINQDVCSDISADKSEAPGYSFLAEGTTNATWGGSTQGTLDDLAEQDNDIQEQSAGYSSDEGREEDEEEEQAFAASSSQQLRQVQLNNSNTNNATSTNKDPLSQTATTTRDLLSMSLESGRLSLSGNVNTTHSNATSVTGSGSLVPPPAVGCSRAQRQGPASHNVWRKASTDSGASVPRAVWTPSSQQVRQENLCTAEELVSSSNNLDTNNSSSSATLHNAGLMNSNSNTNWWQQQALQLQHQLEVTSNLCQRMLLEQAQQQHGSNLLAAVGSGSSLLPQWGFPPPPYPTTPHPQAHSVATGGLAGHLLPVSVTSVPDVYYQQLLAASQLQQQQMMLTTVNHCCQLLWLQQREIMALRSAVHALQEKASCENGTQGGETYASPIVIGQPEEAILITSNQNSVRPTPHQSHSNLTRLQQTTTTPSLTTITPHQNLKLSYSGGLFPSPEEMTGSSGVTSAHSLPNLSQTTTSANSVFSPHHADAGPSNMHLNNVVPNFSLTPAQNLPASTIALSFPMNNNVNFNNRSQQQPLSSLIQCSAPQSGSGAPWLQQGASGGTPGLLQGHTAPSPVPALNNQVPPGNRANNYWDNFRSYSRQNLLSTSTKSNEGVSHSPSPLVDRSHNTLRGSFTQSSSFATVDPQLSTSVMSQGMGAVVTGPEQNMSRKEKLNAEQCQNSQDNMSLSEPAHNNVSDTTGLHDQVVGMPGSANCHRRLRDRHNSSDIQLQQNISRPRAQRQILVNENDPRDSQLQANVPGLSGLVGCASSAAADDNFSSVPEFHLESDIMMDISNMSLTGQDIQNNQNFALTSESLSSYRCSPGSRDNELCEYLHVQSEAAASVRALNRMKAPKSSLPSVSESQQNCTTASTTEQKPQHVGSALFEALSDSVYSEVAALISANENRPHFLIQLFRDLQMISSDPLRQRTLQSIQEVVSRSLASTAVESCRQPHADIQQPSETENVAVGHEHFMSRSAVSCDEENVKDEVGNQLAQSVTSSVMGQGSDAQCLSNLMVRCESGSGPHSIAEGEEGAAALLPSAHSSPRALPRNAAWNVKDGMSLPIELPGRSSKLDWEVQAVLVDLLPFLKAHLDDTCSSCLLEGIRRLTLQLVRAQNLSHIAGTTQHSSQPSRLSCCYQGQLDPLLEDALLKFQGCRLRDICEELLTVVAEVLLNELTFLRLVGTVSRGDSSNEGNEECCKNSVTRHHDPEERTKCGGIMHQPAETTQHFLTSETGSHTYHESRDTALGAKAYNGDLAEADQSHHEESVGGIPELEAESAASMSVAEEVPSEGHSIQAEGTSTNDSCIVNNAVAASENDLLQADDRVAISDETADFTKTEMEEEWEVEQDREQGLDRVPTRLSTDQQRAAPCSGSSTPERDCHSFIPHPANQPDAPGP